MIDQSSLYETTEQLRSRAAHLIAVRQFDLHVRTDRLFAWLMGVQWLSGILLAWSISPWAWEGSERGVHPHLIAAVVLGGAVSGLAWVWIAAYPGGAGTRSVIALCQMLWSSLLIHLTGGRIETHFHIFGSLAFLAFYRDARVILVATAVVVFDHFLRGLLWPYSVYGVLNASLWRTLEHSAWVVFEDVFLLVAIRQSRKEIWQVAVSRAVLEQSHERVEEEVRHRTADLHAAEEQLRQSQKMEAIGRLAGGVAHDFNNILCIVSGNSELLCEELDPEDPNREMAEEILRASQRAAGLTRQLLIFGRRQITAPEVLDLRQIVAGQSILSRLIGDDIQVVTTVDPDLRSVKSDAGQLEQVLMNLVLNSRDAMGGRAGCVTIELKNVEVLPKEVQPGGTRVPAGHYVSLSVSDDGCGMDEAVKARLFEPFFTTKPKGKGTGLGLATVYGIVKQWDGHIDVSSTLGAGSNVRVFLPAVVTDAPVISSEKNEKAEAMGSGTILLVEDEEAVRAFARRTLTRRGYRVIEASDGVHALEVARRETGPIDLLVTDVVMPRMGGRILAETLVAERPGLPYLFMSGYTDDAVLRHGIMAAETNFLAKPFNGDGLARKVREVLEANRLAVAISNERA